MNITITFRHMVGTDAVKNYAHEKVAKLQKFLRQAMTAQVTLSVEGLTHVADVRLSSGSLAFHATERGEDMYASIDMVHDKLEPADPRWKGTHHGAEARRDERRRVRRGGGARSGGRDGTHPIVSRRARRRGAAREPERGPPRPPARRAPIL